MSVYTEAELAQRIADLNLLRERIDAELRRLLLLDDKAARKTHRRSRHVQPECGTEEGYQWHYWRKQKCDECRVAHAAHTARAHARRRAMKRLDVAS